MIEFLKLSVFNLSLRGLSLVSKFILVVFIGKYLSTTELGIYGLFTTTITLAVYLVGLDFYTYNSREILSKPQNERLPLIRDQFLFHLAVYLIVFPLLSLIFFKDIIPIKYLMWFYVILIFEHVSQEFYRLFTVLSRVLFANIILFVKTGLWAFLTIGIWISHFSGLKTLNFIWICWSAGVLLSVVISFVYLRKMDLGGVNNTPINWTWIKDGIRICVPFFVGTIAYKMIEFADRYMIDFWMTRADVGLYTFYCGIANVVNVAIFTAVSMVYYPKLIEFQANGKKEEFKSSVKQFSLYNIGLSFLMSALIIIFINPVLQFMGKMEFVDYIRTLWVLILVAVILNISYIPHYILYAQKRDRVIILSTVSGAVINIMLNLLMIPRWGIIGAAIATGICFSYIGVYKFVAVRIGH